MRVALPWLGYACGACHYCNSGRETLCMNQLNMGYAHQRRLRRVRARLRPPRRARPGRRRPRRRRAADVRRRHDLQGGQGLRGALVGSRRGVRRRRPRPPRRPVRAHHRRLGRRRRRQRGAAGDGARARRRARRQRRRGGPGRGDPAPRRRRRRDRHRGLARSRSSRPTGSLARGGRLVCVGLPADNHMEIPIFETVLGGARHPRLDRRHPPRPRRGLRAAPPRADHGRVRGAPPRTRSTRRSSRSSTAAPARRGSCSAWLPSSL